MSHQHGFKSRLIAIKLKYLISHIYSKQIDVRMNVQRLDRLERKRNILIYGLPEDPTEKPPTLERKILKLFLDHLQLTVATYEVDFVKRYYNDSAPVKLRPVVMGLTTWKRKVQILSRCSQLKGTGISITEDYPRYVLARRRALNAQLETHRKEGKFAVLKYDKLYVAGTNKTKHAKSFEKAEEHLVS